MRAVAPAHEDRVTAVDDRQSFDAYERAIDAHIKNLRRKIEVTPHDPRYLLTVYGVGYRLADDR